jgi:hypothetical protein
MLDDHVNEIVNRRHEVECSEKALLPYERIYRVRVKENIKTKDYSK